MKKLTKLEKQVLEKFLAGNDEILINLRKQICFTRVIDREMTGVGFFTSFEISEMYQLNPELSGLEIKILDVDADIAGLDFGAGFLLYIENGLITMLEGYTYGEPWPDSVENFKLSYNNEDRNLTFINPK